MAKKPWRLGFNSRLTQSQKRNRSWQRMTERPPVRVGCWSREMRRTRWRRESRGPVAPEESPFSRKGFFYMWALLTANGWSRRGQRGHRHEHQWRDDGRGSQPTRRRISGLRSARSTKRFEKN